MVINLDLFQYKKLKKELSLGIIIFYLPFTEELMKGYVLYSCQQRDYLDGSIQTIC